MSLQLSRSQSRPRGVGSTPSQADGEKSATRRPFGVLKNDPGRLTAEHLYTAHGAQLCCDER